MAVGKNIIESNIDVSSLPGKFTSSSTVDGALIMDQVSQDLLEDLLDNQQVRWSGSLAHDTQWHL